MAAVKKKDNILIHIVFIIICLLFLVPFLYVVSISFSDENVLAREGYRLIPSVWSTEAYRFVFKNPHSIVQAYKITAIQAFLGMGVSVAAMALCAYSLSRKSYIFAKPTMIYILITMLFGAGMVPSYIINTKYLGLADSMWVYILPGMVNGFQVVILRTFFSDLPSSLIESAKMDGACETVILLKIILPLSKPVIATVALLQLLDRWNSWTPSLLYITNKELYTLQYLLQRILKEAEYIKNMAMEGINVAGITDKKLPSESARFAMCLVATGPMLAVFPFFQKYFTKGLTVGAVKG